MFDDDLENTSPDGSGAKEGEGGTRGPEGAKGPLVTRRNFIAACLAGASAMLLWPRAAKADGYEVGGGWFGSAGNWAILKHGNGNWIGSKSGWFSWVCGHHQWIGVAAAFGSRPSIPTSSTTPSTCSPSPPAGTGTTRAIIAFGAQNTPTRACSIGATGA